MKVSSSVLALDVWSHYLAIGSNVVQMVDMSSDELRRILFVEDSEKIPVCEQIQLHIYNIVKFCMFSSLSSALYYHSVVSITFRAPPCPHTLLHLLVKKVTWPQQRLTALW